MNCAGIVYYELSNTFFEMEYNAALLVNVAINRIYQEHLCRKLGLKAPNVQPYFANTAKYLKYVLAIFQHYERFKHLMASFAIFFIRWN